MFNKIDFTVEYSIEILRLNCHERQFNYDDVIKNFANIDDKIILENDAMLLEIGHVVNILSLLDSCVDHGGVLFSSNSEATLIDPLENSQWGDLMDNSLSANGTPRSF